MADFDQYEYDTGRQGNGFMMGLLAGAVLGAGIGMLLAPKAGTEIRGTLGERARTLGSKASEQYRRAAGSASGWAEKGRDLAEKGRDLVDKTREKVTRTAEDAREYTGATTGSTFGGGTTGTTGSTFGGTDYGRS